MSAPGQDPSSERFRRMTALSASETLVQIAAKVPPTAVTRASISIVANGREAAIF
jgi:hypothetical protein